MTIKLFVSVSFLIQYFFLLFFLFTLARGVLEAGKILIQGCIIPSSMDKKDKEEIRSLIREELERSNRGRYDGVIRLLESIIDLLEDGYEDIEEENLDELTEKLLRDMYV